MNSNLKKTLRARAHALKPVVLTGQAGITPALVAEIDRALTDHELIKVRFNADDRQDRSDMMTQVCGELNAELVQTIGKIAILYRKNPEKA